MLLISIAVLAVRARRWWLVLLGRVVGNIALLITSLINLFLTARLSKIGNTNIINYK